jgi:hypothetical protein
VAVHLDVDGSVEVGVGPEQRGRASPSAAVIFLCQAGSLRTDWTSRVLINTSADWSRCRKSMETSWCSLSLPPRVPELP